MRSKLPLVVALALILVAALAYYAAKHVGHNSDQLAGQVALQELRHAEGLQRDAAICMAIEKVKTANRRSIAQTANSLDSPSSPTYAFYQAHPGDLRLARARAASKSALFAAVSCSIPMAKTSAGSTGSTGPTGPLTTP